MSNLIPVGMDRAQLGDVLRDILLRIEEGDSYEGNIEWAMPIDAGEFPDDKIPEGFPPSDAEFWVRGVYRVGNSMGQGGIRMIGNVPIPKQDGVATS